MEASVSCRPGAPGRGQQDVPALTLPVPSGPAHTRPVPVPKQPPPPPPPTTGSAPAASRPHPHGPAPALTANQLFSSAQQRTTIIRMNFRGFPDEFPGLNTASAQEVALSSVRTNREVLFVASSGLNISAAEETWNTTLRLSGSRLNCGHEA